MYLLNHDFMKKSESYDLILKKTVSQREGWTDRAELKGPFARAGLPSKRKKYILSFQNNIMKTQK